MGCLQTDEGKIYMWLKNPILSVFYIYKCQMKIYLNWNLKFDGKMYFGLKIGKFEDLDIFNCCYCQLYKQCVTYKTLIVIMMYVL